MAEEFISVLDLAEDLGIVKTATFKVLSRFGIQPVKRRDASRGNQLVSCVTRAEAERVKKEYPPRTGRARSRVTGDGESQEVVSNEVGVFYVIQLEPEHDPGRIKVGFAVDMNQRLNSHRCSAPFAQVVRTWPCRRIWETTAIDCVMVNCEQVRSEVYRTDSVDQVLAHADAFFEVMPSPDNATDGGTA